MPELTLIEVLKYAIKSLISSKVFILFILEIALLAIYLIFNKKMNQKLVKRTTIIASLIIAGFYVTNYVNTIVTFINNVSTKLMELIYFPTTFEFMIVMVISFAIMFITLLNKKSNKIVKVINSILPISISFLFLSIIEYINVNKIAFDEFSVFTDPVLMSLYELSMGIFVSWLLGLIIYKADKYIISKINTEPAILPSEDLSILTKTPEVEDEDYIEMPRLKSEVNL